MMTDIDDMSLCKKRNCRFLRKGKGLKSWFRKRTCVLQGVPLLNKEICNGHVVGL